MEIIYEEYETAPRGETSLTPALYFMGGLALGVIGTLLMDPIQGARRRARIRDKGVRLSHSAMDMVSRRMRDMRNRTRGLYAEMRSRSREIDDQTLYERVRAELGHAVTSARSILTQVRDGVVTLSGRIPEGESEVLLSRLQKVKGVKDIVNQLEVHAYLQ